ncbi:MAG: hypothetical protein ACHREM_07995 [Polyangiales bacterium]
MSRPQRTTARALAADTRGSAMTEYVVLVGTVGLAVVVTLVAIGPKLVKDFEASRQMIVAPSP